MKRVPFVFGVTLIVLVTATAAFAVITGVRGGPITKVTIARSTDAFSTTSTSYVNVPGGSAFIGVGSGDSALILARFSAESVCFGAGGWCSVRILLFGPAGAVEMNPASGSDFAFDSTDAGRSTSAEWESHSMDRSSNVVGAGSYTVVVQAATVGSPITFRLDDYSLTVERSQVS